MVIAMLIARRPTAKPVKRFHGPCGHPHSPLSLPSCVQCRLQETTASSYDHVVDVQDGTQDGVPLRSSARDEPRCDDNAQSSD